MRGRRSTSSRRDAVLFHAKGAVGCGDTIGARWKLQHLDWPDADGDEMSKNKGLAAKFYMLCEHFKLLRDQAPKKQRVAGSSSL